jgi:CheY-like chemotaxis protein
MNTIDKSSSESGLVIDDEPVIRKLLIPGLSQGRYTIYEDAETNDASVLLEEHPRVPGNI